MSSLSKINIHTYLSNRELKHCPRHFVKTKTNLTPESYNWILEKTVGRFVLVNVAERELETASSLFFGTDKFPAFEDSSEAMLYELTWS